MHQPLEPKRASSRPGKTHAPQSMKSTLAAKRAMTTTPARLGAIFLAAVVVAMASAPLVGLAVADAAAQTLANPNAPPKWSPPQGTAKSRATAQTKKSCKEFGAGFVNLPGTDACVKIGGFVTVEGGTRGR
jgi:Porin subfamily